MRRNKKLYTNGQETKLRLIETVEKLLAERHELDLSLRDITSFAGVNVAAVSYHFGSKDALVQKVIDRATSRLARRQLIALEALAVRDPAPSAGEILEAWVTPSLAPDASERIAVMARVARRAGNGKRRVRQLSEPTYEKVRKLLFELLAERWPHLPAEEVQFRITATRIGMAGLMSAVLDNPGVSQGASLRIGQKNSRQILEYIIRAMSEPAAMERKPRSARRPVAARRAKAAKPLSSRNVTASIINP